MESHNNLFLYEDNEIYKVLKSNNREEWKAKRIKGIGGSDASAVINQNPYKSCQKLYREKKGLIEIEDISDKPYVQFGTKAEEHIRSLFALDYQDKYEVQYMDNTTLQSTTYDFMLFSPDGLLYETETGRKGILEVKTTTILQSRQYENWKGNYIPPNYYIQCLHGLLVTGFDFVVLRARIKFNDESIRIATYVIDRDQEEVQQDLQYLLEEEYKFWHNNFLRGVEPNLVIRF